MRARRDAIAIAVDATSIRHRHPRTAALASLRLPPLNAGFDYQLGGAYAPPAGVDRRLARPHRRARARALQHLLRQRLPDPARRGGVVAGEPPRPDPARRGRQARDRRRLERDPARRRRRPSAARRSPASSGTGSRAAPPPASTPSRSTTSTRSPARTGCSPRTTPSPRCACSPTPRTPSGCRSRRRTRPSSSAGGPRWAPTSSSPRSAIATRSATPTPRAYGDHVLVIEYRRRDFNAGCAAFPNLSIVLRDLDLVTPADKGYVYAAC